MEEVLSLAIVSKPRGSMAERCVLAGILLRVRITFLRTGHHLCENRVLWWGLSRVSGNLYSPPISGTATLATNSVDDRPYAECASQSPSASPVSTRRPIASRIGGGTGSSFQHWPDAIWATIPPDERPDGVIRYGYGWLLLSADPATHRASGGSASTARQG